MSNPTGKGGFQERKHQINRKGRPKSFDALRELAQAIAHEPAKSKGEPLVIDGHVATVTEAILRQWAQSKDARLQQAFIKVAYGEDAQKINLNVKGDLRELSDAELDELERRLAAHKS